MLSDRFQITAIGKLCQTVSEMADAREDEFLLGKKKSEIWFGTWGVDKGQTSALAISAGDRIHSTV